MNTQKIRCEWSTSEQIYVDYHDLEWGVPSYDDHTLFEMLILEGCQAGLSWITILKRRENYRKAYDNFNPKIMAEWGEDKINTLMDDSSIIRNRLKITAAKLNAQAFLCVVEKHGSFSGFIWSFVNGKPMDNKRRSMSDIPAITEEAIAMSKALKKEGFKFVGPTICYAYMQSVGMVNDHVVDCFRYSEIQAC